MKRPDHCRHCLSSLFKRSLSEPWRWVCASCNRFPDDGYKITPVPTRKPPTRDPNRKE